MIASGVGMGVRTAAASFGLDFVALGEASYYRAARHARADERSLAALEAAAARIAAHTLGYPAAAEVACPSDGIFRRQPQRAVRQGG